MRPFGLCYLAVLALGSAVMNAQYTASTFYPASSADVTSEELDGVVNRKSTSRRLYRRRECVRYSINEFQYVVQEWVRARNDLRKAQKDIRRKAQEAERGFPTTLQQMEQRLQQRDELTRALLDERTREMEKSLDTRLTKLEAIVQKVLETFPSCERCSSIPTCFSSNSVTTSVPITVPSSKSTTVPTTIPRSIPNIIPNFASYITTEGTTSNGVEAAENEERLKQRWSYA